MNFTVKIQKMNNKSFELVQKKKKDDLKKPVENKTEILVEKKNMFFFLKNRLKSWSTVVNVDEIYFEKKQDVVT